MQIDLLDGWTDKTDGYKKTKMILAANRFEQSKNEDRTFITKTDELSDEIFFDFRFPKSSQLPVWRIRPEVENYPM